MSAPATAASRIMRHRNENCAWYRGKSSQLGHASLRFFAPCAVARVGETASGAETPEKGAAFGPWSGDLHAFPALTPSVAFQRSCGGCAS